MPRQLDQASLDILRKISTRTVTKSLSGYVVCLAKEAPSQGTGNLSPSKRSAVSIISPSPVGSPRQGEAGIQGSESYPDVSLPFLASNRLTGGVWEKFVDLPNSPAAAVGFQFNLRNTPFWHLAAALTPLFSSNDCSFSCSTIPTVGRWKLRPFLAPPRSSIEMPWSIRYPASKGEKVEFLTSGFYRAFVAKMVCHGVFYRGLSWCGQEKGTSPLLEVQTGYQHVWISLGVVYVLTVLVCMGSSILGMYVEGPGVSEVLLTIQGLCCLSSAFVALEVRYSVRVCLVASLRRELHIKDSNLCKDVERKMVSKDRAGMGLCLRKIVFIHMKRYPSSLVLVSEPIKVCSSSFRDSPILFFCMAKALVEVAQEELATKLECTTLAMEKNNIGESLNDEEQTLIGSGAKTKLLLREYKEIIEVLNDNVNKDKHDLTRIMEVVREIVPLVASDCLASHLELFNSHFASLVNKSEEAEIRELIHMLVTSDQMGGGGDVASPGTMMQNAQLSWVKIRVLCPKFEYSKIVQGCFSCIGSGDAVITKKKDDEEHIHTIFEELTVKDLDLRTMRIRQLPKLCSYWNYEFGMKDITKVSIYVFHLPLPCKGPSTGLHTNGSLYREHNSLIRWYLDVAGQKNSKLYTFNGVALFLMWLLWRSLKALEEAHGVARPQKSRHAFSVDAMEPAYFDCGEPEAISSCCYQILEIISSCCLVCPNSLSEPLNLSMTDADSVGFILLLSICGCCSAEWRS
ncbi:hypothetical protein C3L33_18488, partial [Rhododendron williamsianum]